LPSTKEFWNEYLDERRGTYEFRCGRYSAVGDRLLALGLTTTDSIVDVGAGRQEFARYMREQGWNGMYMPIDGSIDGTDIEIWEPFPTTFYVAIELLEHLAKPFRLMAAMNNNAVKGVVATTPNPATVDVLAIDRTHQTPISEDDFHARGWQTEIRSFFSNPDDSILAWAPPTVS
jgi:hypothetical protein